MYIGVRLVHEEGEDVEGVEDREAFGEGLLAGTEEGGVRPGEGDKRWSGRQGLYLPGSYAGGSAYGKGRQEGVVPDLTAEFGRKVGEGAELVGHGGGWGVVGWKL